MVCRAGIGSQPQGEKKAWSILSSILKNGEFLVFEYSSDSDALLFYDSELKVCETIPNYRTYLKTKSSIHPDDRQTIVNLYHGKCHEPAKIRLCYNDVLTHCLAYALSFDEPEYRGRRIFVLRNITEERNREKFLEKQATLDPLTMLLNYSHGRQRINEYLRDKDPYKTCGMIVVDIDYFKYVNDTYGHLFGDQVLVALANLLKEIFKEKDIVMRFGGDEFAVLVKDIEHAALVQKSMQIIDSVHQLKWR